MDNIDNVCVNAIRMLSVDAIQKANSGHPGMPLGSAPIAYELWAHQMKHNGKNPAWANRDRFILSAGHGSAMLYSLLHFFGYGLTLDDLMNFRQDGSLTPGHPEYCHTKGVEATTGPLGAGMGMAVGMAIAEKHLAAVFNKESFPIVDHYTFALGGDGCMMEGISSEVFSLAGTLQLNKLIILYDSNNISIEGNTDIAFSENVEKRMEAFGFQTLTVDDGNNLAAIGHAIEAAKADKNHPSFITIKTQIGYGCPEKQGKASAHGEPLGADNVIALKENLAWPDPQKSFSIPDKVYAHYEKLAAQGEVAEKKWNELFVAYCKKYPEKKALWEKFHAPIDTNTLLTDKKLWDFENKPAATRTLSGKIINHLKDVVPQLFGGSADLAPSNKTNMDGAGDFSDSTPEGRNLHFGVRELGMAAITNGLVLHGGIKPYAATFFVFSDYMKPMLRLAALMNLPVIYVLTHDSIGVGEDGPTHEPIEQLAMLRATPNVNVFRPADATETIAAWYAAITSQDTPTVLALTRQNLPQLAGSSKEALKGGYIISEAKGTPVGILIATGSEVSLALDAQEELAKEGIAVRVVSMPSLDVFEKQSEAYKENILPKDIRARVAIEAGVDFGWGRYVGLDGTTVTMHHFGASAPADVLFKKFGFTKEHIILAMKEVLKK